MLAISLSVAPSWSTPIIPVGPSYAEGSKSKMSLNSGVDATVVTGTGRV